MLTAMNWLRGPLLPNLPPPARWAIGVGLLGLCLWLPAFAALFHFR